MVGGVKGHGWVEGGWSTSGPELLQKVRSLIYLRSMMMSISEAESSFPMSEASSSFRIAAGLGGSRAPGTVEQLLKGPTSHLLSV